jgi:hypothetical protein
MKLDDIAAQIQAHLERFAADPTTATTQNIYGPRLTLFASPTCCRSSNRVLVRYVGFRPHGAKSFTSADAAAYLAWLDAGNVGQHLEWERAAALAAVREARGL